MLRGGGPWHHLPLEVERAAHAPPGDDTGIAATLAGSVKRDLGVSARVLVLPPRALPRSEGKTRRVLRLPGDGEAVPGRPS